MWMAGYLGYRRQGQNITIYTNSNESCLLYLLILPVIQITSEQIHFWNYFCSCTELVLACETQLYPPRFTLNISRQSAHKSTSILVQFKGATADVKTEIELELPRPGSAIGSFPGHSYPQL